MKGKSKGKWTGTGSGKGEGEKKGERTSWPARFIRLLRAHEVRDIGSHLRDEVAVALADPSGDVDFGPLPVERTGNGDDEVFEDWLLRARARAVAAAGHG